MNFENIGPKLKSYLDDNYIRYKMISDLLGIDQSAVTMIFQNKRKLNAHEYTAIVSKLGLEFTYFLKEDPKDDSQSDINS